jgi:hypothetical protein
MKPYKAVENRPSAALRCVLSHSTYVYVRLTTQVLHALHLDIFEQPDDKCFFQRHQKRPLSGKNSQRSIALHKVCLIFVDK